MQGAELKRRVEMGCGAVGGAAVIVGWCVITYRVVHAVVCGYDFFYPPLKGGFPSAGIGAALVAVGVVEQFLRRRVEGESELSEPWWLFGLPLALWLFHRALGLADADPMGDRLLAVALSLVATGVIGYPLYRAYLRLFGEGTEGNRGSRPSTVSWTARTIALASLAFQVIGSAIFAWAAEIPGRVNPGPIVAAVGMLVGGILFVFATALASRIKWHTSALLRPETSDVRWFVAFILGATGVFVGCRVFNADDGIDGVSETMFAVLEVVSALGIIVYAVVVIEWVIELFSSR